MESSNEALLTTIKQLGFLKDTLRTAWTSQGKQESTAEHSWRLALFCLFANDLFPEADELKLVKLALCHDLGEAYTGDIAAPLQTDNQQRQQAEYQSVAELLAPLSVAQRQEWLNLIQEYQAGTSYEAQIVKALDKMETIIQHNQGATPQDFDYAFNLQYGKNLSDAVPELSPLRKLIDAETAQQLS